MSFSEQRGDVTISGDFSRLEKLVEELGRGHYVDIGILGEDNQTLEGGLTTAGLGAVHEFGTDRAGRGNKVKIPERSFLRMPLETGQEQIESGVSKNYQKNLEDGNIKAIFVDIGIYGNARIQEAFETAGFGTWPPNSPVTIEGSKPGKGGKQFIKGKGSASPLIDEGTMRQSISYKVGP